MSTWFCVRHQLQGSSRAACGDRKSRAEISTCGVAKLAQRNAETLACMSSHQFAGCAVMLQGCDVHLSNSNAGISGRRHPACILVVRPDANWLCGDTAGMWRTAEGTMRSACLLAKEDARAPNGVARVAGTSRARWPRRCNGWRSGLWRSSHWAPARQRCAICDSKGAIGYGTLRIISCYWQPKAAQACGRYAQLSLPAGSAGKARMRT